MALQGKFIINDADFSPFTLYGVGTFMAFSGKDAYRNHGGCFRIPKFGPLPPGKYYIVDRPQGSIKNVIRAWAIDTFNTAFRYYVNHAEWFALYRIDGVIDDKTIIDNIARDGFRLHPGRISEGCITLPHYSDFNAIRNALFATKKEAIPGTSLRHYGIIEVIVNGTTCP
ncbi:DUF2778 domain-containing protein [Chimaeribacter arupi]|uniref:DUF2778 domain-containing protein n=1 Tax=Chimaeribacter arupi TaxID=2060066 RepID=UPI000C7E40B1|nr:DUF2778 domain-containing protein [Chimaeribacter arupi]PLR46040.1 hypothetical protein CYR52_16375 [Chimaeribacter arupi]